MTGSSRRNGINMDLEISSHFKAQCSDFRSKEESVKALGHLQMKLYTRLAEELGSDEMAAHNSVLKWLVSMNQGHNGYNSIDFEGYWLKRWFCRESLRSWKGKYFHVISAGNKRQFLQSGCDNRANAPRDVYPRPIGLVRSIDISPTEADRKESFESDLNARRMHLGPMVVNNHSVNVNIQQIAEEKSEHKDYSKPLRAINRRFKQKSEKKEKKKELKDVRGSYDRNRGHYTRRQQGFRYLHPTQIATAKKQKLKQVRTVKKTKKLNSKKDQYYFFMDKKDKDKKKDKDTEDKY